MPVIERDSKTYFQLIEAIEIMEDSLKPASTIQILKNLANLRLHFPTSDVAEQEASVLMRDYLTDMATYPADIIHRACIEYRRDVESQYFPKIGKLLNIMNKYWYDRRWKLEKLKKLLSVSINKGDSDGKSK
jgi:hypothetical protein